MTSHDSQTIMSETQARGGKFSMNFQKFIKVSRTHWDYGGLELIAEVGGYVGLFLGVSVNQLAILTKVCFNGFQKLRKSM